MSRLIDVFVLESPGADPPLRAGEMILNTDYIEHVAEHEATDDDKMTYCAHYKNGTVCEKVCNLYFSEDNCVRIPYSKKEYLEMTSNSIDLPPDTYLLRQFAQSHKMR
ncbi:MAG: hypothetical protein WCL06_03725 [Bacteroidota bacterium]